MLICVLFVDKNRQIGYLFLLISDKYPIFFYKLILIHNFAVLKCKYYGFVDEEIGIVQEV